MRLRLRTSSIITNLEGGNCLAGARVRPRHTQSMKLAIPLQTSRSAAASPQDVPPAQRVVATSEAPAMGVSVCIADRLQLIYPPCISQCRRQPCHQTATIAARVCAELKLACSLEGNWVFGRHPRRIVAVVLCTGFCAKPRDMAHMVEQKRRGGIPPTRFWVGGRTLMGAFNRSILERLETARAETPEVWRTVARLLVPSRAEGVSRCGTVTIGAPRE